MVGIVSFVLSLVTYGSLAWWAGSVLVRSSTRGVAAVATLVALLVVSWLPAFAVSAAVVGLLSFDTGHAGAYFALPYLLGSLLVFGVALGKIGPRLRSKPTELERGEL